MKSIPKYIREHIWITALVLIVMGFALLWGSTYLQKYAVFYALIINLAASLIVSAIALWILSHSGREVEKRVDTEFETIRDQIKIIGSDLTNKLDIVAEAKNCGVVHIFASRRTDGNFKTELIKRLKATEGEQEVLIMSNSLRDFFGPATDKDYLFAIFEMLKKAVQMRILLLDPTSDAAQKRALVEEKQKVIKDGYIESTLFTDIEHVANRLNKSLDTSDKDIRERIQKQIRVRFCPNDPTTHIIRTDKFTFIEQYHSGGDEFIKIELSKEGIPFIDCFGGFIPVLMVDNTSFFAKLMKSHFENIWASPDVEERDLREKNYYQIISQFMAKEKKKAKPEL